MNIEEDEQIFMELVKADHIEFNRSFEISKICSKLLKNPDTEKKGRELVIRILDVWEKLDPATYSIWTDLIEMTGLYPYLVKNEPEGSGLIRHEFHRSRYLKDIYFHEEQMNLSLQLNASKSVIVSAPTSFGKSLLIEEIIASKKYKNIVIIQPTLALLDETRKKLGKYQDHYRIIVSTSQRPSEDANLFLLTAERVVEYQDLPKIDFFVIDEFYKLSMVRDDERASMLNYAFYKLLKMINNFYLLGPNIANIPEGFEEEYNAKFIKSDFSTVAVDIQHIKVVPSSIEEKENKLFELLKDLKEPTIIYCSAPGSANKLMTNFVDYCKSEDIFPENIQELENLDLVEWIGEYVHPNWKLREALIYSIAVHHGGLPRHIGSSIVDYFNQRKVKYLFCTATLIEGVNTTAKNVILFHKKKGLKQIDYFDFLNIVGRSGRMKEHFIGRIFKFYDEPASTELLVDMPFYTQTNAKSELLVQLEPKDIKVKNSELYKKIENLEPDVRELVKRNKGIPIEGQLDVIKLINGNIDFYHPLLSWTKCPPRYQQLKAVIELALDNLLKIGESRGGVKSPDQLTFYTFRYLDSRSTQGFIKSLLKSHPSDEEDKIINESLQVIRHWFEYKLPKLLETMSEIQSFVFSKYGKKPGNYTHLAAQLENSFLPDNLAILLEYGIPATAIRKLQDYIDPKTPVDKVLDAIKKIELENVGLMEYELNKLKTIL